MFQLIIIVICILIMIVQSNVPSTIYLGGQFRSLYLNSQGQIFVDTIGQQQQAAFIVAINQINNKTDGIFDNLLPNTKIEFAVDWGQNLLKSPYPNLYFDGSLGSYYIHHSFPDVSLVVATSPYETNVALSEIFIGWNVPVLTCNSTRTEFSHGLNYPLSLRMPAAESFDAVALASMISKYYKWEKISIFYTTDIYGLDCYHEFTKYGDIYGLKYLSTHALTTSTTDFRSTVETISNVGSTIYVLLMDLSFAKTFLSSVYYLGMLKTGTQVLGTSAIATPDLWSDYNKDDIKYILKGLLTVKNSPELFYELPQGKEFISLINHLPPTITIGPDGNDICSNATDSVGTSLYKFQGFCAGFVDLMSITAADLDPNTMMTYEAVIAYANAADHLIRNDINVTGVNIHNYLANSTVLYENSSVGEISFSSGDATFAYFGRGDRQTGHIYEVLNYHYNESEVNYNDTSKFVTVAVWSTKDGGFTCRREIHLSDGSFYLDCNIAIYRTANAKRAIDHRPDVYKGLDYSLKYFYLVMAALIIFENIIFIAGVIYYRDTRTIKNSQIYVILVVNLAILIGAIRPIIGAMEPTINLCQTQLFVEHICFRLLFGTVMLKLWRIDKVVNATSFKRLKISEFRLLQIIAGHLILLLILLSIIVATNGLYIGTDSSEKSNQTTLTKLCKGSNSSSSSIALSIIYALEVGYLVLAAYYLFRTRAVPAAVNETALVGPAMLGSIVFIVVAVIIIFVLNLSASSIEIIVNVGFIVKLFFGSAFYYISKYLQIRHEIRKKYEKAGLATKVLKPSQVVPTANETTAQTAQSAETDDDKDMNYMKQFIINQKDYHDKIQLIQNHINVCKVLLMRLADEEDASSLNSPAANRYSIDIHVHEASTISGDRRVDQILDYESNYDDTHQTLERLSNQHDDPINALAKPNRTISSEDKNQNLGNFV